MAAVLLTGVGLVLVFLSFVFGLLKNNVPYQRALAEAEQSLKVREAIGQPIEPGLFVNGQFSTSGDNGEAKLLIPISGPKGDAQILVEATKRSGRWTFSVLTVQINRTGQRIDLQNNAQSSGDLVLLMRSVVADLPQG